MAADIAAPLLWERFPDLSPRLPWTQLLTSGPTPVPRVAVAGHTEIWIKRDDLADARYGGNKARKFEWILGDLKAKGYREMVTVGGFCSNHCTAAAMYATAANIGCTLLFTPTPLDSEERDLLRVQASLGARQYVLPCGISYALRREAYVVPPGGSSTAGIFGYVNAGLEFAAQIAEGELPKPDFLYIAAASRGTVLGLAMGLFLAGLGDIRLVAVETVTPAWQKSRIALPTARRAYALLRRSSAGRALPPYVALSPRTDRRFERLPLGVTTPAIRDAMQAGRQEAGIVLDAHFAGKAFAALRADLRDGRLSGKKVLFWQTHGQASPYALRAAANTPLPAHLGRSVARCLTPLPS